MRKNMMFHGVLLISVLVTGLTLAISNPVVQAQDQTQIQMNRNVSSRRKHPRNRRHQRLTPVVFTGDISGAYTGKLRQENGATNTDASLNIGSGSDAGLPGSPPVKCYPFTLITSEGEKSGRLITFTLNGYTAVAMSYGINCLSGPIIPDLVLSVRACNAAVGRTGEGILLQGDKGNTFFASGGANCRRGFVAIPQPETAKVYRPSSWGNRRKARPNQRRERPPQQNPIPPPVQQTPPSVQGKDKPAGVLDPVKKFIKKVECVGRALFMLPQCRQ
jgi:hypothetical protein